MKEKRNEPCPCGSGAKYKKCHYLIKWQKWLKKQRREQALKAKKLLSA